MRGVLGLPSRTRIRDVNCTEKKAHVFFLCEEQQTQQTQHTQLKVSKDIDFKGIYLCWVCVELGVFCVGFDFGREHGAMIEEMETLLKHWGEQCRCNGEGGGMGSPMATIMEWGGCAPRGTPGSRIILGAGAGPDGVTQEITAALSDIARQDERGQRLVRLASLRYGDDPAPSWLMQLNQAGIGSLAKQTYYDQVHALHLRLLQALMTRAKGREQLTTRRRSSDGILYTRASMGRK